MEEIENCQKRLMNVETRLKTQISTLYPVPYERTWTLPLAEQIGLIAALAVKTLFDRLFFLINPSRITLPLRHLRIGVAPAIARGAVSCKAASWALRPIEFVVN